jgi:Tfp pilus assembly protein PilX
MSWRNVFHRTNWYRFHESVTSDQSGMVLPLVLLVLLLASGLMFALLGVSSTEVTISTNLKRGDQALAHAEAGIERAIWALSNPTEDTAGPNTKLVNLNAVPAAYNGQVLFPLTASGQATPAGAYSVTISGVSPTTIVADGYVLRNGVALPAGPAQLAAADITARRRVKVQVTANGALGGAAAPGAVGTGVGLPGALIAAGNVQMSGSSLADGLDSAPGVRNSCANSAGVTIRNQNPNGTANTLSVNSNNRVVGSVPNQDPSLPPGAQSLTPANFNPYLFTDTQLAALKTLAQTQGTYVMPTSNTQFQLNVQPGLVFVDTVNGQPLGNPPDPSLLSNVKISGVNTGGWVIVMGSITIDGNVNVGSVNYHGLVYAVSDVTLKGTGGGGIYGSVVTANITDSLASVVDTDTVGGNSNIFYDCTAIATGGGTFGADLANALNAGKVAVKKGTWREVSN